MVDVADKLACFQAVSGLENPDLCTEILAAHGWDLELAISSFTGNSSDAFHNPSTFGNVAGDEQSNFESVDAVDRQESFDGVVAGSPPGLAWKLITLPVSIVSGSLGLISGAFGLGFWVAGGVLSYSLGMIGMGSGWGRSRESSPRLISVSAAAAEAMNFAAAFEKDYGARKPNFVSEGFMDALQRSRNEYKLLFVYLHSPDHPDTHFFCERTLCSDALSEFVNENFVPWGGSIQASEGFKMCNSLKASRFPFCAVVMAATNQRIALLQQTQDFLGILTRTKYGVALIGPSKEFVLVEGPKSAEELLMILQRVLEESTPVLTAARLEAEERRDNLRLREEQDAAYREALEADQARERQKREELERLEREAAEAERRNKEEEEARERAALEAAEKEAALTRLREEKALSLGKEPEKGPDVTQVLVRFPTGERRDRRFHSTTKIQSVYDYVDSLGFLEVENYSLVSNFPRVVYGSEKLSLSLQEAGLHPQASLFVESN